MIEPIPCFRVRCDRCGEPADVEPAERAELARVLAADDAGFECDRDDRDLCPECSQWRPAAQPATEVA